MDEAELQFLTAQLEAEERLKESLRDAVAELERTIRSMTGAMSKIHSTPSSELPQLVESVQPFLERCRSITAKLAALVPENQFWRWKDMWARHLQSAVFVIALCEFITSGKLAGLPQARDTLGINEEWDDRLRLPTEDYLHGLITLVNELARLAVNAVVMKDYGAPSKISTFVKDLAAGFSLLNLKNDSLRRRFDGIKYDVKRVEEVVYDVTLRNLNTSTAAAADTNVPESSNTGAPQEATG